jgi:hypothetical protein
MPLFFFAGVAASIESWTPAANWGNWLMRRCTRLYRPVFYYLAFWWVALASVGWGLKEEGLYCVAAMLVALLAARRLADDPQRVCAASLPARMT